MDLEFIHIYGFTIRNINVNMPTRQNGIKLCITQWPIINAITITTYKEQGDSLPAMVVANWRSKSKADNAKQGYLLVSRALNRDGFYCLEPLTIADCLFFKPNALCLQEDSRLNAISDLLIDNFYNNRNI